MTQPASRYNHHIPHGLLASARNLWAEGLRDISFKIALKEYWKFLLDKELCPNCKAHIKNYEEELGEHKCYGNNH